MKGYEIAIVGEAWGEQEERARRPFVGAAGQELGRLLSEAGIDRASCFLTNVFNLRPPGNKIEALCGGKEGAIAGYPILTKGRYVRREYTPELERLAEELDEANPNLVVCLGNTASWALLGKTAIKSLRGYVALSTHCIAGFKCLPTYHPAAIFRQYEIRPIVVADLRKAARESGYPEIRRPKREIWIEPTIEDILRFERDYVRRGRILSVDIETSGFLVTCIGFASGPRRAIVIPFYDPRKTGRSYWPTAEAERKAWVAVRRILQDPEIPKVFQNGLYDIAFLWRSCGIRVFGAEHDTMLLHHALQPESIKDLGFLGSIYTDEGAWKKLRLRKTTIKSED